MGSKINISLSLNDVECLIDIFEKLQDHEMKLTDQQYDLYLDLQKEYSDYVVKNNVL